MPRFENEGYNPNRKYDGNEPDRTVPESENYYGSSPIDLNFNNRQRENMNENNIVRDNQINQQGFNPCRKYDDYVEPPAPPKNYGNQSFHSETPEDFEKNVSEKRPRFDLPLKKKKSNSSNGGENKKKRSHHLSVGKRILIAVLVIILILTGSIFPVLARINYDEKKDNSYVDASSLESSALVKNILLIGVDARKSDKAEHSNSDTMMLISVDMKHRCIKLVSFLRDSWVYIPSIDRKSKLNAACANGGYQGVVDTIEYNFGVKINGYVVTDFEMFKVLVDSLGGVEIDVTKAEAKEVTGHKKRYGNVKLESGKHNLTGEQALAYCRIRYIDSDFGRTKRQRTVMNAIIKKATHSNPFKLYKMAFSSAPYIETNLSKGSLMRFAASAGICITGDIHQTKVPFEGTWSYETISGTSAISIDKDKNKEKLIDYVYNKSSADIKAQEEKDK